MDGGAWWAAAHGVEKSRTRLSDFTLLQGIFLTQGSKQCLLYLLHWQAGSLPLLSAGRRESGSKGPWLGEASALKGETVPDSLPATPKKSPDTPGSPEGNTEGPGTASSEPLLPS